MPTLEAVRTESVESNSGTGFFPPHTRVSPLVIADRLLTLAQDADRAGFAKPAERLLKLAYAVCNEKPH